MCDLAAETAPPIASWHLGTVIGWRLFPRDALRHYLLWLALVTKTGFSHRLTPHKILGHFLKDLPPNIEVKNIFFRISNISVTCPHAQLTARTVLQNNRHFFGPWVRDRSQSPPCWIFRVKQIHQSTASERATRLCYDYFVKALRHQVSLLSHNQVSEANFHIVPVPCWVFRKSD